MRNSRFVKIALVLMTSSNLFVASCRSMSEDKAPSSEVMNVESPNVFDKLLLDVSDVSILFPVKLSDPSQASSLVPHPEIRADRFMTQTVLNEILAAAKSEKVVRDAGSALGMEGPDPTDIQQWRVMAFRFDPCAPNAELLTNDVPDSMKGVVPGCLIELRLILQAEGLAEIGKGPRDGALHLVYDLGVLKKSTTTEEAQRNFEPFMPLIRGLQKIKSLSLAIGVNTDGQPLGVHPGLKAELEAGRTEIANEVTNFLTTFLNPSKLTAIAVNGLATKTDSIWEFFSGTVAKGADRIPHFVLGRSPAFHKTEVFGLSFNKGVALILPRPEDETRSLQALLQAVRNDKNITAEMKKVPFEIAHPKRSHVFNTDCHACHQLVSTMGMSAISASDSPDRYINPIGISGYRDLNLGRDSLQWVFRNFGYDRQGNPSVSPRTVAESAEITDLSNRLIAGDGHRNPGLDCGTDRKKLDEIWDCSIKLPSHKPRPDCFKSCTIVGQKQ